MANKFDPQRIAQLKLLLTWEGWLGNARLRDILGLTTVRASQWIREFKEEHPAWTQWDSVRRISAATPEFYRENPLGDAESIAEYLSLVGLPSANDTKSLSVVVAAFAEIATPKPQTFALLTNAARMKRVIEITYRSMGEPKPHIRTISPHSVVRAGRRWHARAYCELKKQFRDFALGRIVSVRPLDRDASFTMKDDKDWMTEVQVRLIAHPDLSQEQEDLIRFEYFQGTAARVTTCRGPLVSYYVQDIRAAVNIESQCPPDYQLAVENMKEVGKWLFPR